jgi:histidinol phosphatase-like PHP family hydrolase
MELSNRWNTPYDRLMKKAVDAGVKFSMGSDGHEPVRSCALDFPKAMVEKYGLKPERIFDVQTKFQSQTN